MQGPSTSLQIEQNFIKIPDFFDYYLGFRMTLVKQESAEKTSVIKPNDNDSNVKALTSLIKKNFDAPIHSGDSAANVDSGVASSGVVSI